MPETIKFTYDGSAFQAATAELDSLLSAIPNLPDGFFERLNVLFQAPEDVAHLEACPTVGTRILLKPSQRFLDLLSALRAGLVDLDIFQHPANPA